MLKMYHRVLLLMTCMCGLDGAVVQLDATACKHGVFTSPNWPSDYDNDLDLEWELTTNPSRHIVLSLDSCDLQGPEPSCHNDYLKFLERGAAQINICGNSTQEEEYTSATNSVRVIFHSDHDITRSGFRLLWHPVCDECELSGCVRTSPNPTCIRHDSCRWGYYLHDFTCNGDHTIQCKDDFYTCVGQTYSDCKEDPAYNPDLCTLERETPCAQTAGISIMLQQHSCVIDINSSYPIICSRPCCCVPLVIGPHSGPFVHCGSEIHHVDQYETDFPGFRSLF